METNLFAFVWNNSKREQFLILLLTLISFPLIYFSLEIPKIIINDAISGIKFPKNIFEYQFEQIEYLLFLCGVFLILVILINAIKWVMNVLVGLTGERLLRRLRYSLFERAMRFRIARFRSIRSGEVIQSILGEIEPLGGFFGEVIATPIFQGGLLVVYLTFIFVQDWTLGLAAVALYPLQAFIIPKLQNKIVSLNRKRSKNTRKLADKIGEAVSVIPDVHTNDTALWHLAQVSQRLYENTIIRLQLFKRKFTIKFINNFLNQLTPFMFYSIGGYLVIKGELDFGSLVAVLAAYKDVAGPWKEVLNYSQRWTDFKSRYDYIIESFTGDDILPKEKAYVEEQVVPLKGDLVFRKVEGGPSAGALIIPELQIPQGSMVAVLGGDGGAREAFLRMTAGLEEPAAGGVVYGGQNLLDCSIPQIGRSVSYVGSDPGIVSRSLRENLLYGLFSRAPELVATATPDFANLLREARLTGNIHADPNGDWVDYDSAELAGPEALEARLMEVVGLVGLSSDIYTYALEGRLDGARVQAWEGAILSARRRLRIDHPNVTSIVEDWRAKRFNTNGSLLENVLYASLSTARSSVADVLDDQRVWQALLESGADESLVEIGADIAREFHELITVLQADSVVLDSFQGFQRADILAASELVEAVGWRAEVKWSREQRNLLIRLAAGYIPRRDRFDVLSSERRKRLLRHRKAIRIFLASYEDFIDFDEKRFMPGRTIGGNVLHGKRRFDRRSSWKKLDAAMEKVIGGAGLREDFMRIGLRHEISSPSSVSSSSRRKIGLARGLIKKAPLLVMDGVAGTNSSVDVDLRGAVRGAAPSSTIIYAALEAGAETGADMVVEIANDGSVRSKREVAP
ncbi:MAG: hypothetical protein KTR21_05655 [Rhodobacteraceae bacterium]|nr:hypothetical protein [Paracoccaceae bacterium]